LWLSLPALELLVPLRYLLALLRSNLASAVTLAVLELPRVVSLLAAIRALVLSAALLLDILSSLQLPILMWMGFRNNSA
jgi:hypothetical protein